MKNKILIVVYVASLDENYDIYIPVNETVAIVLDLVLKSINDISDNSIDLKTKHFLLNPITLCAYAPGVIIRETDIKNNTKLILI